MTKSELKSKLEKSIEFLQGELSKIRTGRANPSILESVRVNAYDTVMSIKELGSVAVADSQLLLVTAWDSTLVDPIAKAIRESELNLNPAVDGNTIRVPIPDLTEERRKDLAKSVSAKVEDTRNVIRNIRQDAMKDVDNDFTNKLIGEDDKFKLKDEVESTTKEFNQKAVDLGEVKKQDLLKI
ncbi:ribosome recycling factor [candidate division WWE3 bacterium]|nr:ribosome recycling factor [candidate division WWE3 bacterium]